MKIKKKRGLKTVPWDSASFKDQKDQEDPAKETEMKWQMREEENKKTWCPGSQAEEVEGVITCVKAG